MALPLIGCIIVVACLVDHPFLRIARPYIPVACLAIVGHRLITAGPEDESLLDWICNQLPSKDPGCGRSVKDVVGVLVLYACIRIVRSLRRLTLSRIKTSLGDFVFSLVKPLPAVQRKLKNEADKLESSLEHSLRPQGHVDPIRALPGKGRRAVDIVQQLQGFAREEERKWRQGLVSGAVYGGEDELMDLMGQAAALYSLTNPLHPDLFPSLMKFEAEICSMVANMVNGGNKEVAGALTSGGTESIILAAKTHRDFYREEKGVTEPEIVACVSAHAAIDKACDLMGIRVIKIAMDLMTFALDLRAMERAITSNTIMLYASAPTFGQGVIDPVEAVARLGCKYGVGVHVDCCLGGFILPFAKRLGYDIPPFDFSVKGVTSMSVDTHKYGFASKGTSVVLYRNKQLRRYQYFCFPAWCGGLYVTPTIAGSRPGALSASCWAALVHIGDEGYMARAKQIMDTTQAIADGVSSSIPELHLQGQARAMIVCVGSKEVNIYNLGDTMAKKGWSLNSLQNPPGLHLCVTLRHVGKHQAFVADLKQAVEEVKHKALVDGKKKQEGNAAIYGMASTLPAGPINEMLRTYTDVVLKA